MMDDISQKERIAKLAARFEAISNVMSVDIPSGRAVDDVGVELSALRMMVAAQTLKTAELALEQISVCFAISKHMFFYEESAASNIEILAEENSINRGFIIENFKMVSSDYELLGDLLSQEFMRLQFLTNISEPYQIAMRGLALGFEQIIGKSQEASLEWAELNARRKAGLPFYDDDQKPDLKGKSPESMLKTFHMASVHHSNALIDQNIVTGEKCLNTLEFMTHGMGLDYPKFEEHISHIFSRFEVLRDVRDNRIGWIHAHFD